MAAGHLFGAPGCQEATGRHSIFSRAVRFPVEAGGRACNPVITGIGAKPLAASLA
jgi:hypothetical protein